MAARFEKPTPNTPPIVASREATGRGPFKMSANGMRAFLVDIPEEAFVEIKVQHGGQMDGDSWSLKASWEL
jgi:hypothetical protein